MIAVRQGGPRNAAQNQMLLVWCAIMTAGVSHKRAAPRP